MADLISVIVSTYNRADALDAVLRSLSTQTDRNFEIIAADDGSRPDTGEVVARWSTRAGVPVKHVWHEDQGFRLAEIRNRAILASQGAYCIFLDGDCLALPGFIAAHRGQAQPGWFVTGSRLLLSEALTARVLTAGLAPEGWSLGTWIGQRLRGGVNRIGPMLLPWSGVSAQRNERRWRGARGSNMAFWRADLDAVDGFDAAFVGWGREDSDMFARMIRHGIRRRNARLETTVLHLWHPEQDRSRLEENERQLEQLLNETRVCARQGLSSIGAGKRSPGARAGPAMKVLIVTLRRLGDVLLTTPLVRSVRRGFPGASVDMLVFAGGERILKGNPDIDRVITTPERPSLAETAQLLRALWRQYDLAICTQTGDRPTFMTLAAGRRRVGLVPGKGGTWKRFVHHRAVIAEPDTHRVSELLRLADALDVPRQPDLVCPQAGSAAGVAPAAPYAVLHPNPLYRYKRWNDAGWRDLARGLSVRGLAVVVTQGRGAEEGAYVDHLFAKDTEVIREQGRLDWAGLTALLQGAVVYVGPDTSVTHLAAGSGCPTVALYGAVSPRLIGPWPVGGLDRPWAPAGRVQRRGNVWMVQNPLPCLPCEQLGCDRHLDSRAQCLDELTAVQVLEAVDQALERRRAPVIA